MKVAILLYEGFAPAEVAGTNEVLTRLGGSKVVLVASEPGEVRADRGPLSFQARSLTELPHPDILVVPGSRRGVEAPAHDGDLIAWIQTAAGSAEWVLGVSEGVALLGAAGVLQGRDVTTHWSTRDVVRAHGARVLDDSRVVSGNLVPASGLSGGVDAALVIAAELRGQPIAEAIQLAVEWEPEPPFDSEPPAGAAERARELIASSDGDRAEHEVAIFVYEGFTSLDWVGPYDVLSRVPGLRVELVTQDGGAVTSDTGAITVTPTGSIADVPRPDIVLVPGSNYGFIQVAGEQEVLSWLRSVHDSARLTTSVCSGSVILAAAGLLEGLEATGHWLPRPTLAKWGAIPVHRRIVDEGEVVTAGGVSSGIDFALYLVQRLVDEDTARAVQVLLAYEPDPPFDSGSVEAASPATIRRAARSLLLHRHVPRGLATVSASRWVPYTYDLVAAWLKGER